MLSIQVRQKINLEILSQKPGFRVDGHKQIVTIVMMLKMVWRKHTVEGNEQMAEETRSKELCGDNKQISNETNTDTIVRSIPQFREKPGPNVNLDNADPICCFNQLWTDELSNISLMESNRYAQQYVTIMKST